MGPAPSMCNATKRMKGLVSNYGPLHLFLPHRIPFLQLETIRGEPVCDTAVLKPLKIKTRAPSATTEKVVCNTLVIFLKHG